MASCSLSFNFSKSADTVQAGAEFQGEVVVKVDSACRCDGLTLAAEWRTSGKGNSTTGQALQPPRTCSYSVVIPRVLGKLAVWPDADQSHPPHVLQARRGRAAELSCQKPAEGVRLDDVGAQTLGDRTNGLEPRCRSPNNDFYTTKEILHDPHLR